MNMSMTEIRHVPVLLNETVQGLRLQSGDIVVDGTLGSGGHSLALLKCILPNGVLIALDTDVKALERFSNRSEYHEAVQKIQEQGVLRMVHANYSTLSSMLEDTEKGFVSGILVDLGFSSDQMDTADRGMSFSQDGLLDMRLDQDSQALTAAHVVNEYSETKLVQVLQEYGEEKYARAIAKAIIRARTYAAIQTTKELAEIIAQAIPKKYSSKLKIHPATKSFQAIRIEVNQELEHLRQFLPQAIDALRKGGRLAVITFHSGEDRIVKSFFQENARGCICPKEFPLCRCYQTPKIKKVTSKPIVPSQEEIAINPRSRSAKLRIIEKC